MEETDCISGSRDEKILADGDPTFTLFTGAVLKPTLAPDLPGKLCVCSLNHSVIRMA